MSNARRHIEPASLHNLGDVVCAWGPQSDDIAVIETRVSGDRVVTYRELAGLSGRVAHGLRRRGLAQGSRIGLLGDNSVEYLAAYFGIMQAGYTVVPVNKKLPPPVVAAIATDAALDFAFADAGMMDLLPSGLEIAALERPADASDLAALPVATEPVSADAELLYTSGSSGVPKGVRLSHAGQIWGLAALDRNSAPGTHTHIVAQPLYHMNGIVVSGLAFLAGGTVVLQPGFAAPRYVAAIARYRVDTVSAVPTMWARALTLAEVGAADLSSVRRLSLGSAPVSAQLLARTREHLPDVDISISYGTTEAGPAVFGPHPDGIPSPDLALGYPLPGVEVRFADAPGVDEGVLEMRTPAMMCGYRGQPERTAEVLREGWYYSGDVMRRDENGFYTFIGRADDMLVCSGENIYPAEVERLLESHPDVRQAAVVPLADDERGHVPVAFVVLAPDSNVTAAQLQRHALDRAAPHLHPRRLAFRSELPLAGTNKIDRSALRHEAVRLESEGGWSQ